MFEAIINFDLLRLAYAIFGISLLGGIIYYYYSLFKKYITTFTKVSKSEKFKYLFQIAALICILPLLLMALINAYVGATS
jgi:hypothetical protein